ncbi:MAG: hypothetical protein KJO60_04790, partial [Desulfofustis sp.]|nr:hypothetical protein [Desulfofustis sp.]
TVHHLDEEEEEIFPLATQLFEAEDLDTLGALFEKAKEELLGVSLPELPKALAAKFPGLQQPSPETGASQQRLTTSNTAFGLGIGGLK